MNSIILKNKNVSKKLRPYQRLGAILMGLTCFLITDAMAALSIAPDNAGQISFIPYYTVRGDAVTKFSISNESSTAKAVYVHINDGVNNRSLLGFSIYFAPGGTWNGEIQLDLSSGGGKLIDQGPACTVPWIRGDLGGEQELLIWGINDGDTNYRRRLREGYITVTTMADITNDIHDSAQDIINGDCNQLVDNWTRSHVPPQGIWITDPNSDAIAPTNGIRVSYEIIDRNGSVIANSGVVSVQNAFTDSVHTEPGDSNTVFFPQVDKQAIIGLATETFDNSIDSLSAVLMQDTASLPTPPPDLAAASSQTQLVGDWIVTFPTQRYYIDPDTATDPVPASPFTSVFTPGSGSCDPASIAANFPDSTTPDQNFGSVQLCNAVNIVRFGDVGSLVSSQMQINPLLPAIADTNGQGQINFDGGSIVSQSGTVLSGYPVLLATTQNVEGLSLPPEIEILEDYSPYGELTSIDFGNLVDAEVDSRRFSVINHGDALIFNCSVGDPVNFSVTPDCSGTLTSSAPTKSFEVFCNATGNAGEIFSEITFTSNDPNNGVITVPLRCNRVVTQADIFVNKTAVDFGSIFNDVSVLRQVFVRNFGISELSFTCLLSNTVDFEISSCGGPLAELEYVNVETTCLAGTTLGSVTSDLIITSNDPDEGSIIIPLSCQRVSSAPKIFVNHSEIDFLSVPDAIFRTLPVFVQNFGKRDLSLSCSLSNPTDFSVNNCDGSLSELEYKDIEVSCSPGAILGDLEGELIIDSNDPAATSTVVNLLCEGISSAPIADISPDSETPIEISPLGYNQSAVTISNIGVYNPLNISCSLEQTGDYPPVVVFPSDFPNSVQNIAANTSSTIVFECGDEFRQETSNTTLSCGTNDVTRPTIKYQVYCLNDKAPLAVPALNRYLAALLALFIGMAAVFVIPTYKRRIRP